MNTVFPFAPSHALLQDRHQAECYHLRQHPHLFFPGLFTHAFISSSVWRREGFSKLFMLRAGWLYAHIFFNPFYWFALASSLISPLSTAVEDIFLLQFEPDIWHWSNVGPPAFIPLALCGSVFTHTHLWALSLSIVCLESLEFEKRTANHEQEAHLSFDLTQHIHTSEECFDICCFLNFPRMIFFFFRHREKC